MLTVKTFCALLKLMEIKEKYVVEALGDGFVKKHINTKN